MGRKSIVLILLTLVICNFCGKDFVKLGSHIWRCKSKSSQHRSVNEGAANSNRSSQEISFTTDNDIPERVILPSTEYIECACGKECKGLTDTDSHYFLYYPGLLIWF